MNKICVDCDKQISVYATRCSDCQAERVKVRDRNRKKAERTDGKAYAKVRDRHRIQRELKRAWICEYLSNNCCVDCGEADIVVLQFDHTGEQTKTADVTKMLNSTYSLDRIKAEIGKCEVRCANCHARKTVERLGGSYRTKWLQGSYGVDPGSIPGRGTNN